MPKDVRPENTMFYTCCECGKLIDRRLPRGLRGRYAHAGCIEIDKVVAKALPDHRSLTSARRAA